jgi:hypothetical protein
MKYTLLEYVQSVLRSIKGEQVNSISDTQESLDVADIVKQCYYTWLAQQDLPETKRPYELIATDVATPVLMTLPEYAFSLESLRYNIETAEDTEDNWTTLQYIPLQEFRTMTNNLNTSDSTVDTMTVTLGSDTFEFKYRNDVAPSYYTNLDDEQIVFDAYDSGVDTFLQKNKTEAYGIYDTSWTLTDGFIPRLDAQQVPILLREAQHIAWVELKSVDNPKAAKDVRRMRIATEAKKFRANYVYGGNYQYNYPNYGRR